MQFGTLSLGLRLAIAAFVFVIAVGGAAILVAYSGVYSVAASRGHSAIADWFLTFGMRNSGRTHSARIVTPPLTDQGLVALGAAAYETGCAVCHGAPGNPANLITMRLLPIPPSLWRPQRIWEPREHFWIVKHGLKYAGMPGWVALERDDEIWAMTAFLQRLPSMSVDEYRHLAYNGLYNKRSAGGGFSFTARPAPTVQDCVRCHGTEGEGTGSDHVPRLEIQTETTLFDALKSYVDGARPSGIMQPVLSGLDEQELRDLARLYASTAPKPQAGARYSHSARASPERIELGRRLATEGAVAQLIPGCIACHGDTRLPEYPALAGQHAVYMEQQLRLWQSGGRSATPLGQLMAPIAKRMSDEQIRAASAYFASLPPTAKTSAAQSAQ